MFRTSANEEHGTITRSVFIDLNQARNRILRDGSQGPDNSMFGRHHCHQSGRIGRLRRYFNNRSRSILTLFNQVDSCCKYNIFDPLIPVLGMSSTACIQMPELQNQSNEYGAGRLSKKSGKNSIHLAGSSSDHRRSSLARRILANLKRADCVASTNGPENLTISHQPFPVDFVPQDSLHYPRGISTSRNISDNPSKREGLASVKVNGHREETKSTEPALIRNTLGADKSSAAADRMAVLVNGTKQCSVPARQGNWLDRCSENAKLGGTLNSYLALSDNEYQEGAHERNCTRQPLPREWAPFTHRYSSLRKSLRKQSMTNYWVENDFKQDIKRHASVQTAIPWYNVAASSAARMNWEIELTLSGKLTDVPQNGQIRIQGIIKPRCAKNGEPVTTHTRSQPFEDTERLGDAERPHPLQSQYGVVDVATQSTDYHDFDNISTGGNIINDITRTASLEAFAQHFSGTVVPALGSEWEQLDDIVPCSEVLSMSSLPRQCFSPTSGPLSNSIYGRSSSAFMAGTVISTDDANAFVEQENSPVGVTSSPKLMERGVSDSKSGGRDTPLIKSLSTSDHNICLVPDEQNAPYPFPKTVADTLTDVNRASLETLPVPLRYRDSCGIRGKSSSTSHHSDFARGSITKQTSNRTSASSTPASYVDESDCPDSLNITDSEISRINERLHHLCEHPGKPSMMARLLLNRANSSGSSRTPNSVSTGEFGGLQVRPSVCLFPEVCKCSDTSCVMHAAFIGKSNIHLHRSCTKAFHLPEIHVMQKGSLRSKGEVFASHHTDDDGECPSKQPISKDLDFVTSELPVANTSTVHECCNSLSDKMHLNSNLPEDRPLGEPLRRYKSIEESIHSTLCPTVSKNDQDALSYCPENDTTVAKPVVGGSDTVRDPEMCFVESDKLQQWALTNKGHGKSQLASSLSQDGDETVLSGGGLFHDSLLVPNDPVVSPVMEHTMIGDDTTMEHNSGLPIFYTSDGYMETNAVTCDETTGHQVNLVYHQPRENTEEALDNIAGSTYGQDNESSSAAPQVPSIIRLTDWTGIGAIMSEVRLPVMSFTKAKRTVLDNPTFNIESRKAELSPSSGAGICSNPMHSPSFVEEQKMQKGRSNSSDCHYLEHLRCTDETDYLSNETNPHGSTAASSPPRCICLLYTVEQAPVFEDSSFGVEENFHNEKRMLGPFARISTAEECDKALSNKEDESHSPMELGKWFCGAKVSSKVKRYETHSPLLVRSQQVVTQSGSLCVAKNDGLDENIDEELRGSCDTVTTYSDSKVRRSVHSAHRSVLSVLETAVDVSVVLAGNLGSCYTQPSSMTRGSETVTVKTKKYSYAADASDVLHGHGHECVPNRGENCEKKLLPHDLMNRKWLSLRLDYVLNTGLQPHFPDPLLSDVKNSLEKQVFYAHHDTCLCGSTGQPSGSKVVMRKSQMSHVCSYRDMHFYPSNDSQNVGCSKPCTSGLHYTTAYCRAMKLIHNENHKPEARTVHLGQMEYQKSDRHLVPTFASPTTPSSNMKSKTLFTVLCSIPKFICTHQPNCNPADVSVLKDNCLELVNIHVSGPLDCYESYHLNGTANFSSLSRPLCFVLTHYLSSFEGDAIVPTCSLVMNSTFSSHSSVIMNIGEFAQDSNQVTVSIRYQLSNDLTDYVKIDYTAAYRINRDLKSPPKGNVPCSLWSENRKTDATKSSDPPTYNSDHVSEGAGHRFSVSAKSAVAPSNTSYSVNSHKSGRNGSHFASSSPQLPSSMWSSNTMPDRQSAAISQNSTWIPSVLNLSDSYLNVDPKRYNRVEPLPHPRIRSESSGISPSIASNTSQQSLYSGPWCMADRYLSEHVLHDVVNGLVLTGNSEGTADTGLSFSSTRGLSECGYSRAHTQGDPENYQSSVEWVRTASPGRICETNRDVSRTTLSGRHSRNFRVQLTCLDSDLKGRSASLPVLPSPVGTIDYLKHFRTACSTIKNSPKAFKNSDVPSTSSIKQSTETTSACSMTTTHLDKSDRNHRAISYQTQGDLVNSLMRSACPFHSQWCLSVDSTRHRITAAKAENEIAQWKRYK